MDISIPKSFLEEIQDWMISNDYECGPQGGEIYDKISEWHEYLKAFYKASDACEETPEEPKWVIQINNSSCITFENWKEE